MNRLVCIALVCVLAVPAFAPLARAAEAAFWAAPPPTASPEAPHRGELRGIRETLGGQLIFRFVIATAVGSAALMLLAAALAPARVARAEQALRSGRWKVVIVGVISVALLLLLGTALGNAAKGGGKGPAVLAVGVLGFLAWLGVHGLAATARIVGASLLGDAEGTQSAWRVVGVGAAVVAGCLLVPLFGWAVFVYLFCRGVGAATLALFSGTAATPPPEPSEPEA